MCTSSEDKAEREQEGKGKINLTIRATPEG